MNADMAGMSKRCQGMTLRAEESTSADTVSCPSIMSVCYREFTGFCAKQPKPLEVGDDVFALAVFSKIASQCVLFAVEIHFQRQFANIPLAANTTANAFALAPVADRTGYLSRAVRGRLEGQRLRVVEGR
jgi:hypothetical protein